MRKKMFLFFEGGKIGFARKRLKKKGKNQF
jgi:hypothetical protein